MPICRMNTNFKMNDALRREFMDKTASIMSEVIKKPLPAVMVMLDDSHMYMNGSEDTVFFAEFRYIMPEEYKSSKQEFLDHFADVMLTNITEYTHVDPHRIYMQFTEMTRDSAWRYTG